MSLAFVGALQRLPPNQRAALVLRDVLGFRAAEAGAMLELSEAGVNSALQRARATIETVARPQTRPLPSSRTGREVVTRFAEAFEEGDLDTLVPLLTDDAWVRMPPQPHEYQGHDAIRRFFASRPIWSEGRRIRLEPVRANGGPAFAYYLADTGESEARLHGLVLLSLRGERIAEVTRLGLAGVLGYFDLPSSVPV